MTQHAGYTLIEILLVIAIIAITTTLAFPAFNEHRRSANDMSARADTANSISIMSLSKSY